jgi:3-oxoacyl-[acyl-carrier-protein] synthase II
LALKSVDVVVTGIGLISALGDLETTWNKLLVGQSGIRDRQPFPDLPCRPLALIGDRPSDLLPLVQQIAAATLQDAGLGAPLVNCGVVVGSSRSQQSQWETWAGASRQAVSDRQAHPVLPLADWLQSLPHIAAIATAHQIGTTAPVQAPMAACATGLWAIAQGYELIQTGQCEQVLVGAIEAPITPLTLVGFDQVGALARRGAYPFDRRREGLVLGEGGAMLLLETAASAARRAVPIYGRILGWGLTADGYHVSAPDPRRRSAAIAVKQCLDRSGLLPQSIDYIHAHGTATLLNDANEASLIQYLFPQGVAMSSTKGATGHTLGASGAIGAAFCLLGLKHQVLPPCVGLAEAEFDLDLLTIARSTVVKNVLCFSFGFGGQNAVLALAA